eukprot:TRINITY_DN13227_c0_g1_i3.p1 TRINITY_DN13227_c0_g1~~TRINITY_DN13227_c0_g1_i3.p1  ORF type:complete len:241 (-),score=15.55 TRINITY_DN13227_c0_g1_i3:4-726(-)
MHSVPMVEPLHSALPTLPPGFSLHNGLLTHLDQHGSHEVQVPAEHKSQRTPASSGQARDPNQSRRRKLCEHRRRPSQCKECGGSGICVHGRQRNQCKQCGGCGICEHGRIRSRCKDCGGRGICEHGRQRNRCKVCGKAREIAQLQYPEPPVNSPRLGVPELAGSEFPPAHEESPQEQPWLAPMEGSLTAQDEAAVSEHIAHMPLAQSHMPGLPGQSSHMPVGLGEGLAGEAPSPEYSGAH